MKSSEPIRASSNSPEVSEIGAGRKRLWSVARLPKPLALLFREFPNKDSGGGFNRSVQHGRFWVLYRSEVHEWRGWVVQEGCLLRARRSCGSGGGPGSPSATSPGHYRSLPAPFTGCSKPPAASLRPSGAGEGVCTHPGRAGGDLPRARYRRISSRDRSSAGPIRFHCL